MARKKVAKGKKPSSPPKVGGKAPAAVNDTVAAAGRDIKAAFAAEDEWRLRLLKENEFLSKKTVDVEVDVRRLLDEQARLKDSLASLMKEQGVLGPAVRDLSANVNATQKERDLAEAKQAELKDDRAELEKTVHKLSNDNASLDKEVQRLGAQHDKLDADVQRLKKLRDDYVKTISQFKKEKNDLLS